MSAEPMSAASDEDQPEGKGNVIPAFAAGMVHPRRDRSIGAILVDANRLSLENAERILQLQRERGLRFGDAGVALGLLTAGDIDFAISRQFDYPYLHRGESKIDESVVAAYDPSRPQMETLRALRSQISLRWLDNDPGRKAVAIVSATRKEGRSFIAANLAVTFSQLGSRTLLIDADLRNSRQHQLFGLDNRVGLSAALSARAGPEAALPIRGLPDLFVLPAGAAPPNPQELLARPSLSRLLDTFAAEFDVILLDSPPAGHTADAQLLAVRAGAALIVTRTNASRAWKVQGISGKLFEAKTALVGAVLNDY